MNLIDVTITKIIAMIAIAAGKAMFFAGGDILRNEIMLHPPITIPNVPIMGRTFSASSLFIPKSIAVLMISSVSSQRTVCLPLGLMVSLPTMHLNSMIMAMTAIQVTIIASVRTTGMLWISKKVCCHCSMPWLISSPISPIWNRSASCLRNDSQNSANQLPPAS